MSYVVLARKWRPMRFEDLVGQEHVARTLENAIATGRVAHAFLFTGVRGVGKTTSARILAKALNCVSGPTATPCLQCAPCIEIAAGTDVDVREIDGASYTGVDDVRKLQDTLPYRPARDRHKIVIVDEVHMLSQSAWNAFLKTLEEPPPHVKFIFATTEVHKVPVTILSRVQRFDFKLIATRVIAERLRYVLDQERIEADDAAVSIVAREAAGSMRDAMSLLDQVIAFKATGIGGDDVARVLGVASRSVLHEVQRALLDGDPQRCLELVADLAGQGYDVVHVARDLLALLRDMVVAKVTEGADRILDLPDEEKRDVFELARTADTDDLLRLHQGFSQSFDEIARSGQPRAALEMLLVRLARRPPLVPVDDLITRLSALERRLGGAREHFRAAQAPPAAPAEPRGELPNRPRPREAHAAGDRQSDGSDRREEPPAAPSRAVAPAPPTSGAPIPPQPTNPPNKVGSVPVPAPTAVSTPLDDQTLDDWRAIVERVRQQRPELAAVLEHAAPLDIRSGQLMLGWARDNVLAQQATDKASLDVLTRAATSHYGSPTRVTFELDSARATDVRTLAAIEGERRERLERAAVAEVRGHPRVSDAIEILGARLKDIKLGGR